MKFVSPASFERRPAIVVSNCLENGGVTSQTPSFISNCIGKYAVYTDRNFLRGVDFEQAAKHILFCLEKIFLIYYKNVAIPLLFLSISIY